MTLAAGRADELPTMFTAQVASAWDDSFMSTFPPHVAEALLRDAHVTTVSAGEVFYRGSKHADMAILALIADGLVRTYIQAECGRQVTVRYAWPGDVVGLPAIVLAGVGDPRQRERWEELYGGHRLHAEALRETLVLKMSAPIFLELADSEASVACALATSLAYLTVETEQILADGLFLSIRARVARHLMDLAVSRDGVLVVAQGHQEIAEAIGSVREVVSRTLVRLRNEGIVDRHNGETLLLDPAALHAIAAAG